MADKKVKIDIKTTADTSGAEEASEKLSAIKQQQEKLNEAEKKYFEETGKFFHEGMPGINDAIEENAKASGKAAKAHEEWSEEVQKTTDDLKKIVSEQREENERTEEAIRLQEQHKKRLEDVAEAKRRVAERDSKSGGDGSPTVIPGKAGGAVAGAAILAIGASANLATESLSETIQKFRDLRNEVDGSGEDLGPFMEAISETVDLLENPIQKIGEGIKGFLKSFSGIDEYEESVKRANESTKALEETIKRIKEERAQAAHNRSEFISQTYAREAEELERQARALRQINEVRNALNDAAVNAAQLELQYAQQSGGDVRSAQANVIGAQMKAELDALNGRLAETRQFADDAARAAETARIEANDAAQNNPAEFEKLDAQADAAQKKAEQLGEQVQTIEATYGAHAENIIRKADIEADALSRDATTAITTASQQAATELDTQIRTAFDNLKAGVPQVTATAAAPVTQAVQEVTKNIEGERTATAQAVKAIPVPTQNADAIRAAGDKMNESALGMSREAVAAFAKSDAVYVQITGLFRGFSTRLSAVEQQLRSIR